MLNWRDQRLWALGANSAYALASFVLGWLLLQQGDTGSYGSFAFYLLLQAFGYGIVNALFGAPLLIAFRSGPVVARQLKPFLTLALLLAIFCSLLQGLVLFQQGVAMPAIGLLAFSSFCLVLRWFWRCVQQNQAPLAVMLGDLCFSLVALGGAVWCWSQETVSLWSLSLVLLLAALASALPSWRLQLETLGARADWSLWQHGYQQQGKPALSGVVTVEVTANSYQYLIVLLQGAAALAPIAAAGLFLRPMTLMQSSLAQIERPRLAIAAAAGEHKTLQRIWRSFLRWNLLAFGVNVLLVLLLLWLMPAALWPAPDGMTHFLNCAGFVAAAALLRSWRGPASTLLQAMDQFQFLATVTWRASLLTVPLVAAGLLLGGIYGALLAMLLGECAVAWPIIRRCRQLVRAN